MENKTFFPPSVEGALVGLSLVDIIWKHKTEKKGLLFERKN